MRNAVTDYEILLKLTFLHFIPEITDIARKYKNPLTLNPVVFKAAAAGQILTEKQLKSMKRMVRDSTMLNFLNLATIAPSDNGEISADLADLMGSKRSILHMDLTNEILQELVGDVDDLKNLNLEVDGDSENIKRDDNPPKEKAVKGHTVKPASTGRVQMGNSPRRKRVLDQNDFFKDISILQSEGDFHN